MRFRSKGRPRGLLQPRDQRRITLGILAIFLLVLAFNAAGKSGFWDQLFGRSRSVGQNALTDESETLSVVPRESPSSRRNSDARSVINRDEAARFERLRRGDTSAVNAMTPSILDEGQMRTIQDDSLGIVSTEIDAYDRVVKSAAGLKPGDREGLLPARYALFMESPEFCRGKVFSIRGQLRLMKVATSHQLQSGAELYEAWLSLPDSGGELVHVIARAAEPGLPLNVATGKSAPEVELTACYFKREGYVRKGPNGQGDVGLVPLLVAGRIQRFVSSDVTERSSADAITPWLGWLLLLMSAGVILLIWQFRISDAIFRRTRTHQLTTLPVRASFEGLTVMTMADTLAQLQANTPSDELIR